MKNALRVFAGVVSGYAVMVVLITLVQETWFGGVSWGKSSLGALAAAGFLTCVAAGIGGALATFIALPAGRLAAAIMAGLVVVETAVLFATGKVAGPLWFDVAAASSLLVAILVGAEVAVRWLGSTGRTTAAAAKP